MAKYYIIYKDTKELKEFESYEEVETYALNKSNSFTITLVN